MCSIPDHANGVLMQPAPELGLAEDTGGVARPRRTRRRLRLSGAGLGLAALVLGLFLGLPLVALVLRVFGGGEVLSHLGRPAVREGLRLSLETSLISVALVVGIGTPVGYLLARYRFPGRRVLDTLVDLPIILPPSVAGIALLMAFGRRGLLGASLDALGITVAFTTAAVILAQTFVACPFYLRAARAGFTSRHHDLEDVSATLGASGWRTFLRVTAPLARPALASGAVMAWARALGEFGATIMFAGNLVGRTQTMPLAIYSALETDLDSALALSAILVVVSFAVLFVFKALAREVVV
jgi:molybdate transport system permease protein